MDKQEIIRKTRKVIADGEALIASLGGDSDADPGTALDQKVKALMRAEKIESYSQALETVLAAEPDLARQYAVWDGLGDRKSVV